MAMNAAANLVKILENRQVNQRLILSTEAEDPEAPKGGEI